MIWMRVMRRMKNKSQSSHVRKVVDALWAAKVLHEMTGLEGVRCGEGLLRKRRSGLREFAKCLCMLLYCTSNVHASYSLSYPRNHLHVQR